MLCALQAPVPQRRQLGAHFSQVVQIAFSRIPPSVRAATSCRRTYRLFDPPGEFVLFRQSANFSIRAP